MTRWRKCDQCRQRKIKCDEKRPKCDRCKKKNRDCFYEHTTGWIFLPSTLAESTKPTDPMYLAMPLSPNLSLAVQWTAMLDTREPGANSLQLFGPWIDLIPSCIGVSPVLDLAVIYALESTKAHRLGHMTNTERFFDSGAKALNSLRMGLKVCEERSIFPTYDNVLSMRLHLLSEVFRRLGSYHFVIHLLELSKMIRQTIHIPLSEYEIDIRKRIACSLSYDEAVISTLREENSQFDDPTWLQVAASCSPTDSTFNVVSAAVMAGLVQLPRLVRITRLCYKCPMDRKNTADAIRLASSLYQSPCQEFIRDLIRWDTCKAPTRLPTLARLLPKSYHFKSVRVLELLLRFYLLRMILCGIILHLSTAIPISNSFDISEVEAADLEAANFVAMSAQYASELNSSLSLAALHVGKALKIAFGAWDRLSKRRPCRHPDFTFASAVKIWSVGMINHILCRWACPSETESQLELLAKAMAGNAVPPFLTRRVYPQSIIAASG